MSGVTTPAAARAHVEATPVGPPALEVRHLTVRFPGLEADAVADASLSLSRDKVVVVGPNGSGKSTLLQAALGLVTPASGSVEVFGRDVRTARAVLGVGTNLEEVYRLMTIPVGRLLSLWEDLQGRSSDRVRAWLEEFQLSSVLSRPLFRLSTGQAKLVGDLLAVGFDPRLVLLDEPFDNVDFARRQRYLDLLARTDASVLLNTHQFDLLNAIPDWGLYLMFEGQLIGRFRAGDIDRLYVSAGELPGALTTFTTRSGPVSVSRDSGRVALRSVSDLSYLKDRIA